MRPLGSPVPRPTPQLPGLPATRGRVPEQLLEVDVLVELLELIGAGARDRPFERVGERPHARSVLVLAPVS